MQASAANIQVASLQTGGARFIPLNYNRNQAPVVVSGGSARSGLHSDNAQLRGGFMRLDRDSLVVNVRRPQTNATGSGLVNGFRPNPNVVPKAVASNSPQAIAARQAAAQVASVNSAADPVLDLFGGDDSGGAPLVFGRTLHTTPGSGHIWPVPQTVAQKISSRYGMRTDPFTGKPRFHGVIDIAAASGSPVVASAEGLVLKVGTGGGLGNSVTLRHRDGSESTYGHLSAQLVRQGQMVRQGQQIGKVGSTGRSTGSHLDYRISKNGQRFDPMAVLARAPVATNLAQANIRR
jgi:murein DD-endopeptidase MepM/ murein hydrolase activator NlpD